MRKRWILPVVTSILFVAVAPVAIASPGHDRWTRSGTVLVSDGSILTTNPCTLSEVTATQHPLPGWAPGHGFYVLVYPTLDVDVRFYAGCQDLGTGGSCCGFLGATEAGVVPAGADTIVLDHWAGAGRYQINVGNLD